MENQNRKPRYVMVDGQKVYLTTEQRQSWDKFINDTRNEARRNGSCQQPDYHFCNGDCQLCRWYQSGKTVSLDDQNFKRDEGELLKGYVESAEDIVLEQEHIAAIRESLYSYARNAYDKGDIILKLYLEEQQSTTDIAAVLRLPKSTVIFRLNRMLACIRQNSGCFFDDF